MDYSWAMMPSSRKPIEPTKSQEIFSTSPSKFIYVEEIFQDINKQMLETSYTLNVGYLLKLAPNLKKYMWQELKSNKPQINIKPIIDMSTMFIIPNISTTIIIIDNHMVII